jgi:hypothetical protein
MAAINAAAAAHQRATVSRLGAVMLHSQHDAPSDNATPGCRTLPINTQSYTICQLRFVRAMHTAKSMLGDTAEQQTHHKARIPQQLCAHCAGSGTASNITENGSSLG